MALPGTLTTTVTTTPATSGWAPIQRRALDLEDYIDVARRHIAWIMGPVLAGIVLASVVAFVLPNVYVSEAEMQITPAQISESIVPTTINQQLNQRIMQMEQEILSRTSLSNVIQDPRLDLYKSDRGSKPLEDVIEQMRNRDIHIRIDSVPGGGRASAFSISFSYPDRMKAQQTVQALITKFQDSNLTTQRTQQQIVNTFVHDELAEAKAKLDQLNEDLTKFRLANSGKLPEESQLNMAQMGALQARATSLNDQLNRLAQERIQLDTNLQTMQDRLQLYDMFEKDAQSVTPPPPTPAARQHSFQLDQVNKDVDNLETRLSQLRRVYKENYPDVRDAEALLQTLRAKQADLMQKQQDENAKEDARLAEEAKKPQPAKKKQPTYAEAQNYQTLEANLKNQKVLIQMKEMEAANLKKELESTNKQIDAFEARLQATSGIEAQYADMEQNQRMANEEYMREKSKQQLTEQSGELLQRKAGENLDVLDPPSLPVQPTSPKRLLIVGAGTAISFIVGLALAGVQEAKDTSLKNLKDVRAYTNLPVLCSIPLLENTMLVRRKRRIAYLAWSAAVIVGMLAVSAAFYYHTTTTV